MRKLEKVFLIACCLFAAGTLIVQSYELTIYPWHEPITWLRYGEIIWGILAVMVMIYLIVVIWERF